MKEVERLLNTTTRDSSGNLKLVTSVKDDPESYLGTWKLDI